MMVHNHLMMVHYASYDSYVMLFCLFLTISFGSGAPMKEWTCCSWTWRIEDAQIECTIEIHFGYIKRNISKWICSMTELGRIPKIHNMTKLLQLSLNNCCRKIQPFNGCRSFEESQAHNALTDETAKANYEKWDSRGESHGIALVHNHYRHYKDYNGIIMVI